MCTVLFQANKVSCVGVISHAHGGGLAASLSSSDLRGLLPEHFAALGMPVLQYLTAKASPGWAGQQHGAAAAPFKPQLGQLGQQGPQQQQQPGQLQHQHSGSAQAWGLKVRLQQGCYVETVNLAGQAGQLLCMSGSGIMHG